MNLTKFAASFIVLIGGLTLSGCGGATTPSNSSNSNSTAPANKIAAASPAANASPASTGPAAKQGTPPKADMTMTADELHKEYKALVDKDPAQINPKYANKNVQFSGKIAKIYSSEEGTGTKHIVVLSGGKEDDASCSFDGETVESKALQIGQTVTLQGTFTQNQNVPPPLFKCFVIKGGQ